MMSRFMRYLPGKSGDGVRAWPPARRPARLAALHITVGEIRHLREQAVVGGASLLVAAQLAEQAGALE
ncbi:hypothetical protein, partial [Burkholderia sp. Ap-962]|uniref:hypothetical protein n=1 Tax=Burkholderia sp. Ap-962 TaxID=2608333 RepID=UPI0019661F57